VLGKNDSDTPEDFEKGYNFKETFLNPFVPENNIRQKKPRLY
jgi:hypothetical protein